MNAVAKVNEDVTEVELEKPAEPPPAAAGRCPAD